MPGDAWNKAANVRALLAYMWAHPGKQLLFMGQEFGQAREWSEERALDWDLLANPLHGGIKSLVGDLNRVYKESPALYTRDNTPEGFSWIDANDAAGNVLSFLRHGVDADGNPTVLACIANFSGGPRDDYRVGLPFTGRWREVLNTDAESYGGSGVGNLGAVEAEPQVWHGRPASAALRLPPSGVLWLAPEKAVVEAVGAERAGEIGQKAPVTASTTEVVGVTTPADPGVTAGAPVSPTAGGAAPDFPVPDLTTPADAAPDVPGPDAAVPDAVTDTDTDTDLAYTPDEPLDTAPSAGVSADAPETAPETPAVAVSPLGTGPQDAVPADPSYGAAAEDEPPTLERAPGAPDAVVDEPRASSDVIEESVAVGGADAGDPAAGLPSATRDPRDEPGPDGSGSRSSTHQ
jgi:1,4-alpha-glucan branching enzyme